MTAKTKWNSRDVTLFVLMLSIAFLTACGGGQIQVKSENNSSTESQSQDPPLAKAYQIIVVDNVEATPEIIKEYPDALREFQSNVMWGLRDKRAYKQVEIKTQGNIDPDGVLLVKAKITEMRLVGGAARWWLGVFAGSSRMDINLKLVDGDSDEVIREKSISSTNSAWAAAWNIGASDRSLPTDMGKYIAEYVHSIMPADKI